MTLVPTGIWKELQSEAISLDQAFKKYVTKNVDRKMVEELHALASGHPTRLKFLMTKVGDPNRAISVDQMYNMKFNTFMLDGEFARSFGEEIELNSVWLGFGDSGQGKTAFYVKLAKELSQYGRIAYNSLEEGARFSFQKVVKRTGFKDLKGKIVFLHRESIADLVCRAERRKSPQFYFIDSIQYAGLNKAQYIFFKEYMVDFLGKSLIFSSHANGKKPEGKTAEFVMYDADIKIHIDRFRAHVKVSRFGGGEYFDIVPERSKILYDEI
ncbi:MAG: ATP-dependent serine protease [Crocinitomicaceae bacterium]|nr:ATP-dependent serine protease [Crocinitomicaceae bacterium]|tara:strand:- start:8456 stop:9262 length:807 start_codon:yes stop_codon:yes gene_type:complete